MTDNLERKQVDAKLVTASLGGDRDAFGQLIDRYKRVVFSICLSHTRNEADAMDLVQDTFLKAWTKLYTFQPGSNFKAWVCRIAANGSIDKLRRRKTRRAGELNDRIGAGDLSEGKVPSIGTFGRQSPLKETELNRMGKALEAALATLSDTHRQCVLLCDVHGYSYQEIADEMGIPKGTVMSRLFYARKKLQKELEPYREEASRA